MLLIDFGKNCHKITTSEASVPLLKVKGDLTSEDIFLGELCYKSYNNYWLYGEEMQIQQKLKKRCRSRHRNQYGDNMFEASTETILGSSQSQNVETLSQVLGTKMSRLRGLLFF